MVVNEQPFLQHTSQNMHDPGIQLRVFIPRRYLIYSVCRHTKKSSLKS